MKTPSKALYAYLLQSAVLHRTDEDIALAKLEYRKIYKRQWKQQKRPRKEIRIEFTLKDFQTIKTQALELGLSHTGYARGVILSSIGLSQVISHKQILLKVLQSISMAVISSAKAASSRQLLEQISEAERLLLQYLKEHTP